MYAPVAAAEGAELRRVAGDESKRMEERGGMTRRRVALAALALAAVVALGVAAYEFTHSQAFDAFVQWLQTHELVGSGIYVTGFVLLIVLCFPSSGFELLAGYIFGFWLGLVLATAGKLTGSVLSFVIGRYFCRERVRKYLDTRAHPAFRAFQTLLDRRQVLVVFLTRTAFFPIAIKNYGLSALGVGFPVYFSAALLTGLPFSVVWVYTGQAAQQLTLVLASSQSHATTEIILLLVGALSALALLGFVGCYTRKYVLDMAEKENAAAAAAAATDKQIEVVNSAPNCADIPTDAPAECV